MDMNKSRFFKSSIENIHALEIGILVLIKKNNNKSAITQKLRLLDYYPCLNAIVALYNGHNRDKKTNFRF